MSQHNEENVTASKSPSHAAYMVRDRDGQRSIFTRIGAAWAHRDGKGFNIQLECIPNDSRITLRVISESKD